MSVESIVEARSSTFYGQFQRWLEDQVAPYGLKIGLTYNMPEDQICVRALDKKLFYDIDSTLESATIAISRVPIQHLRRKGQKVYIQTQIPDLESPPTDIVQSAYAFSAVYADVAAHKYALVFSAYRPDRDLLTKCQDIFYYELSQFIGH